MHLQNRNTTIKWYAHTCILFLHSSCIFVETFIIWKHASSSMSALSLQLLYKSIL